MEKISKNNKILLVFMGWDPRANNHDFDKSWDLLMQVIERMEDLQNARINLYTNQAYFEKSEDVYEGESRIEATYKFCVDYAQWYNNGGNVEEKEVCTRCGCENIMQNADIPLNKEIEELSESDINRYDHLACPDCEGECKTVPISKYKYNPEEG